VHVVAVPRNGRGVPATLVTLALGRLLSRPAGPLPHTLPGQPWNLRLLLCGAGKLGLGTSDPGGEGGSNRLAGVSCVPQHIPAPLLRGALE
jgi:hypothetical protein